MMRGQALDGHVKEIGRTPSLREPAGAHVPLSQPEMDVMVVIGIPDFAEQFQPFLELRAGVREIADRAPGAGEPRERKRSEFSVPELLRNLLSSKRSRLVISEHCSRGE